MVLTEVVAVASRPQRGFAMIREGRPVRVAVAVVVAAGIAAALLSVLSSALDPFDVGGSASYGISALLPMLFAGVWLIDATIVDAIAQVMGVSARLRVWATASAFAIPILVAFDALRVVQALLDRAGAVDVATGLGYAGFLILGWFVAVITVGISSVYELPRMSALAAALAPPAAMGTLLVLALVIGSVAVRSG